MDGTERSAGQRTSNKRIVVVDWFHLLLTAWVCVLELALTTHQQASAAATRRGSTSTSSSQQLRGAERNTITTIDIDINVDDTHHQHHTHNHTRDALTSTHTTSPSLPSHDPPIVAPTVNSTPN